MAARHKVEPTLAAEIGERIKQARVEKHGMTQRELADLLGVSERSVAAYESGEVVPYRFVGKLETALDVPARWILHGESPIDEAGLFHELTELRQEVRELRDMIERVLERVPRDT